MNMDGLNLCLSVSIRGSLMGNSLIEQFLSENLKLYFHHSLEAVLKLNTTYTIIVRK